MLNLFETKLGKTNWIIGSKVKYLIETKSFMVLVCGVSYSYSSSLFYKLPVILRFFVLAYF